MATRPPFRRLTPTRRDINDAHRLSASLCIDPEKRAEYERKFVTEIAPKRVIRRPVDGKPALASEHQEQAAVIQWWARVHNGYGLPEFALFAIPNGGARDVITGARLKAEGVRKGVLDLCLAKPIEPYAGLYVEMKVGDNKPSEAQAAFIAYLLRAGYKAAVHWNAGSAIEEIKSYLQQCLPHAASSDSA